MRKSLVVVVLALGSAAMAAAAQDDPALGMGRARVFRAAPGQALMPPNPAGAAATVGAFLRQRGASAETVASLAVVSEARSRIGVTHVRLEQRVSGLRVAAAYAKASLNDRGELVHLVDQTVPAGPVPTARVDERAALRAALARLHPGSGQDPALARRMGNFAYFARTPFFHAGPWVERVAIPGAAGLEAGFLVEAWTEKGNQLHHALVSGAGAVLLVQSRTNTDSYNVFTESPTTTTQAIVNGPGSGNAQSPVGWLFAGDQNSIHITGNNVGAYLDAVNNDRPDRGGTTVTDGSFLTAADLTVSPSTSGNEEVAVQNLFYLNNVIHDTLYAHGFTEAAGNFQEDNFGNGGLGSDSVNAEAQDGGGTDNANFATPSDGSNPRMQMYLWTGKGSHQVVVNSPSSATYRAQGAAFGRALTATGITGDVVLVDDATGTTSDACEAVTNDVSGKIALIDRGTCAFVVKVANAQAAGAIAAIVANNSGDSIFTMGGTDHSIRISSVFIGLTDGNALKSALPANATVRLTDPPPLQRDGDVDSDVVWHEYGHGLTWRMIGDMSGPLAGAVGEGMSDVLAVVENGDDRVGEYAFDDPLGIRRFPYTNYPLTYGDVTGAEVHNDGEIYGAIGWQMLLNYDKAKLAKDDLLDDVVDGMNYTPAGPTYEEMRDGILDSIANSSHPKRECLVWGAFAKYGVGVGAQGVVTTSRGSTSVTITESFDLPAQCH